MSSRRDFSGSAFWTEHVQSYIKKLSGCVQELEKMVQQARRESVKADDLVRSLTPRPNWHKLDAFSQTPRAPTNAPSQGQPQPPLQGRPQGQAAAPAGQQALNQVGVVTGSTRDMVDHLVAQRNQALTRLSELAPLQGQLQQAVSLLEPEASPSSLQLQLVDPAVAQAQAPPPQEPATATSAATSAATPAAAVTAATPRAAAVTAARTAATAAAPGTAVTAGATAAGRTAAASSSTADASAAASSTGSGLTAGVVGVSGQPVVAGLGWGSGVPRYLRWDSPVALQPYTLQVLYAKIQDIWAAKAAFDGQRAAQHPLLGFLWTYFWAEHGEQALVAQEGYSLLHALHQHKHQLAMADVFLRVLEGQWQEAVWHDCRHMLEGVALVLETLSK